MGSGGGGERSDAPSQRSVASAVASSTASLPTSPLHRSSTRLSSRGYSLRSVGSLASSATCVVERSRCRRLANGARFSPGGRSTREGRSARRGRRNVRCVSCAARGERARCVTQPSWKKTMGCAKSIDEASPFLTRPNLPVTGTKVDDADADGGGSTAATAGFASSVAVASSSASARSCSPKAGSEGRTRP